MREILEKAVIIESAKTDSGFKYTYASKEAYKIVFIKNDLFHCIRGLTDPHNSCEKELEEKDPKLADFFGKEQLEKEANVKMLNSFLKYIESELEEGSKSKAETHSTYHDLREYLIDAKNN